MDPKDLLEAYVMHAVNETAKHEQAYLLCSLYDRAPEYHEIVMYDTPEEAVQARTLRYGETAARRRIVTTTIADIINASVKGSLFPNGRDTLNTQEHILAFDSLFQSPLGVLCRAEVLMQYVLAPVPIRAITPQPQHARLGLAG